MNNRLQQFWKAFCVATQKEGIEYKDAFQFGASADWSSRFSREGKKTATTFKIVFYEFKKGSHT